MTKITSSLVVLLMTAPVWAVSPEQLPNTPTPSASPARPVASASNPVPSSGHPGAVRPSSCCVECAKPCPRLRKWTQWLFYHPARTDCCSKYRMPPTPPAYTYFERPPCKTVCGVSTCGGGCDGFVAKCGFCTPGHRMFGLFTGHGFGFCGACGSCR